MNKILPILIAVLMVTSYPAAAMVVSDFNDGLQGWSNNETTDFNFTHRVSGGNPDGYALLEDIASGGSGGLAVAPTLFMGDLTGYMSISWDALLPSNWSSVFDPVSLVLSSNSTTWVYTPTVTAEPNPVTAESGLWQSWLAPLDSGGAGWTRTGGSESFAQVLANVSGLAFDLEVTWGTSYEAGLDNVGLHPVPVPAAVWLFGSGLLGLIATARRRRS